MYLFCWFGKIWNICTRGQIGSKKNWGHFEMSWKITCWHRGHSFSTYTKFSKKSTFFTPWWCELLRMRIRGWGWGVRNVNLSETFAYVLNEWPLISFHNILWCIAKMTRSIFGLNPITLNVHKMAKHTLTL